jgi:rod shape determining protein RodA
MFSKTDNTLLFSFLAISLSGLFTMSSFLKGDTYFYKQGMWIILAVVVFTIASSFDYRFLRQTRVVMFLYISVLALLSLLFIAGNTIKGAQSWFSLGGFAFQPSDLMKLVLIIVLAKYFNRRHIEIANIRHILVSFVYCCIPFLLIIMQPDFGSAMVLFAIWLSLVLVSGISFKHIMFVLCVGIISVTIAWNFVFKPYQKARIMTFINPLQDIRGSGYNAYQSTIAVGSGGIFGKGVGSGTQSRLNFLPEYKTDFIFAAYAEEWGFVGSVLLLSFFIIIFVKLLFFALYADSPFEALFTYGVLAWFLTHVTINIGMNLGVMPVTGIPLPFMSYGGSHLLGEALALGVCVGMYRHAKGAYKQQSNNEFLGY